MKRSIVSIISILLFAALLALSLWYLFLRNEVPASLPIEVTDEVPRNEDEGGAMDIPDVATFVENLTIPWGIAFLPDGDFLVTERPGRVVQISDGGKTIIEVPGVHHIGEGGLLGITLHPDFQANRFVYLYVTREIEGSTVNQVERYTFTSGSLNERKVILEIPGARFHDGGRIAFGPDERLYIATGDATDERLAQDANSLAGKILRIWDDGSIPEDNPFGNEVYSYGHRNPQGLTWDDEGNLWITEHGRSGIASGLDEINIIEPGGNYGWPDSQGGTVEEGTIPPTLHSGPNVTWAPASALYWDGSIFFGGLKGETLYEAVLSGREVVSLREHFMGEYGRIRTVALGEDGFMYLTTSNRDGRGAPRAGDDRIVRVNPELFRR